MTTTRPEHQLFAVHDGELEPLPLPPGLQDPGRVHDGLPLGVYEAARTFDHVGFVGLRAHLDRMERSIVLAGIQGPLDRRGLCLGLDRVAEQFPAADSKLRFDLLAGPATALGSSRRVIIQATELQLPPPEVYSHGVRSQLSELQRRRPEVKEAQWVVERRAAVGGTEANFESILVDSDGQLLEGVMSNFFWVQEGTLWTAPVAGVLPGITRSILLELAQTCGIGTGARHARADALHELDEAFFTTSVRSVVPVVEIAGQTLGTGRPGAVTRTLMDAYADYCARSAVRAVDA